MQDNRKSPQNMFRPLLSSVPSTTFYVGKASSAHRSLISRNSSVTTSSNASSDQGISAALDTEGSDQNHDDTTSDCGKVAYPDVPEGVFAFDKMDAVNEDIGHEVHDEELDIQHGDSDKGPSVEYVYADSENSGHYGIALVICPTSTSEDSHVKADAAGVDKFLSNVIPDATTIVSENSQVTSIKISEGEKPSNEMEPRMIGPEFAEIAYSYVGEPKVSRGEENVGQSQTSQSQQHQNCSQEYARCLVEEADCREANQQEMGQPIVGSSITERGIGGQQSRHFNDSPDLKVDFSEGTGISILLKRSSSTKGPVFQGRTFTASMIHYDDRSHAGDSGSSMRSSTGHGSFSASSSIDFSLARQMGTRIQRQSSGSKSDTENYRYDVNMKPQSTGPSLSGISNHASQWSDLASSTLTEENFEVSIGNGEHDMVETPAASDEQALISEYAEANGDSASLTGTAFVENDNVQCDHGSRTVDGSNLELSSHVVGVKLENNSVASFPNYEDCSSHEDGENFLENEMIVMDMETSIRTTESSPGEELTMLNSSVDEVDVAQVPSHSSFVVASEGETEKCFQTTPGSKIDDVSLLLKSTKGEWEPLAPTSSDGDLITAVLEPNTSDHMHGILGMPCFVFFRVVLLFF